MQLLKGSKVIIGCFSRVCNSAEKKCGMPELEMLAIVEAVKHFRPYIFGRHFTVLTDHSALSKCLKTSNPSSRLTRWILNLQEYNFSIDWRPRHLNKVANACTRLPLMNLCTNAIFSLFFQWIITRILTP